MALTQIKQKNIFQGLRLVTSIFSEHDLLRLGAQKEAHLCVFCIAFSRFFFSFILIQKNKKSLTMPIFNEPVFAIGGSFRPGLRVYHAPLPNCTSFLGQKTVGEVQLRVMYNRGKKILL